eukprot:CAMPEP_0184477942 /NCGR_PEP_ID=MMETSP0113_2-20130426/76_1 /TAXON_ID=91329 /ORGANISM="Norrisiella sphaerica, Strain BC52" /LENGTH=739 /DNA_ID=CAMNT_0026855559 /DNA_START=64 /DNA_END=2283 /DNA_ORIENTATION=+
MTTIVKIVFDGDIRRLALPKESPFSRLLVEVNKIYPGRFPIGAQVRYVDDEDDCVTVTSNLELIEAIDMAEGTLKLFVTPKAAEEEEIEFVKVSKDGRTTALLSGSPDEEDVFIEKVSEAVLEETKKQPAEAEGKKQAKEAKELEAKKKAEEKKAEAEAKKKAEEAEAKKKAEEAEAKKKAEAEAKKKAEAQKKAEEEKKAAKLKAVEARMQAEKAKKQAAEAEKAARKAAETAAKKAKMAAKKAEMAAKKAKKVYRAGLSSAFVKDVNLVDGSEVDIKTKLTKKWILKNNGKSPWTDKVYLAKMTKGGLMKVENSKVPHLKPGEEGEVSVSFETPTKPGKHRSPNFFLCYDGKKFGDRFWTVVQAKSAAQQDRPAQEKPPKKSYAQTARKAAEDTKKGADTKQTETITKEKKKPDLKIEEKKQQKCQLGAHFVKDVTFPDDVLVAPGQEMKKTWLIKNTGNVSWPLGTKLISLEGSTFAKSFTTVLADEVKAGEQCNLSVDLVAPLETGKHTARFQLIAPSGEKFGHKYWINVQVSKFPSKVQLKEMAMNFLADEEVVAALQEEVPTVAKEIRQGKKLASIMEVLLAKRPELKKHQFVIFIRPFLQSAERFMGLQLDTLLSMYSFWAMTPFAAGASPSQAASNAQGSDQKQKCPAVIKTPAPAMEKTKNATSQESKAKAAQESKAQEKKAKQAPFKHQKELKQMKQMGFKNVGPIKALLLKHKGDVQKVMNELFNGSQ